MQLDLHNVQSELFFTGFYTEVVFFLPCVMEKLLRIRGWELWWVVVVEVRDLWRSLSCDWSVAWLELSWHLMAWEKDLGSGKDEPGARWRRKRKPWSRTANRWRAPRRFL